MTVTDTMSCEICGAGAARARVTRRGDAARVARCSAGSQKQSPTESACTRTGGFTQVARSAGCTHAAGRRACLQLAAVGENDLDAAEADGVEVAPVGEQLQREHAPVQPPALRGADARRVQLVRGERRDVSS